MLSLIGSISFFAHVLCLLFKSTLVKTADGADEVFGDIFPLGVGGDAARGIAY